MFKPYLHFGMVPRGQHTLDSLVKEWRFFFHWVFCDKFEMFTPSFQVNPQTSTVFFVEPFDGNARGVDMWYNVQHWEVRRCWQQHCLSALSAGLVSQSLPWHLEFLVFFYCFWSGSLSNSSLEESSNWKVSFDATGLAQGYYYSVCIDAWIQFM